jgi:hypothetical protein
LFQKAPKLSRILSYVCGKYFEGTAENLKQYSIAVEALERAPGFDPQSDAIVRVDLHLLRKRLENYYAGAGKGHEVQILLPAGRYAPQFIYRRPESAETQAAVETSGRTTGNESEAPAAMASLSESLLGVGQDRRVAARAPELAQGFRDALLANLPLTAITCGTLGLVIGLSCVLLLSRDSKSAAAAQVVPSDFEDGSTDGWTGFAGAQVAVSNAQANNGSFSLLTTGRTHAFQGPGIDLTSVFTAGQPYFFKVAVRLSDSTPSSGDTVRMTMKSVIAGATNFTTVASSSTVTNTGWVLLQGSYVPPSFRPPPTGRDDLFLYVEDDSNATAEYYIDTFSVAATNGGCTVPPDNSGMFSDFEDGTTQGWTTRFGLGTVSNTTADAHTGSHSLIVQGRTANFQGPARDITGKMCDGQQYWVEAWVKMAPGQPATSINLSLQYTDAAGILHFPGVANSPVQVTDSAWVRIRARPYTFSGAYTNLQIYLQTNNGTRSATVSFYIDEIKVQCLPPVIESIPSIAQTHSSDSLVGFEALQSAVRALWCPPTHCAVKHTLQVYARPAPAGS